MKRHGLIALAAIAFVGSPAAAEALAPSASGALAPVPKAKPQKPQDRTPAKHAPAPKSAGGSANAFPLQWRMLEPLLP